MKRDDSSKTLNDFKIEDLTLHQLMIDESRVACVQLDHPLQHALLILIKSGYSAVPVLDSYNHVVGTISMTLILDLILGLERIEFEQLDGYVVRDAMNSEVPRVSLAEGFLRAFQLLIDVPFICVDTSDGAFAGIITRRTALLKLHPLVKAELKNTVRQGDSNQSR